MPDAANFATIFLDQTALVARVGDWEAMFTAWPIRLAMLCLVLTIALRLCYARWPLPAKDGDSAKNSVAKSIREGAKSLWLIGSFLSLFHAVAAMGFYHDWLHINAMEDTARQTKALLGVSVGAGIYFNYAFVLTWLLDAFWWTASEKFYESRPRWLHFLIYGFIIFIAINGAIIFESGWVRWAGVGSIVGILLTYWWAKPKKTAADSLGE